MNYEELKTYAASKGCVLIGEPALFDGAVKAVIEGTGNIICFAPKAKMKSGK